MSLWSNVEGYIEIPKKEHTSLKDNIHEWFDDVIINSLKSTEVENGLVGESWRYYIEFCYRQGNKESHELIDGWLESFSKVRFDLNISMRYLQ